MNGLCGSFNKLNRVTVNYTATEIFISVNLIKARFSNIIRAGSNSCFMVNNVIAAFEVSKS